MRYGRLINAYRYVRGKVQTPNGEVSHLWNMNGNIGDCIQSIAVENLLVKLGIPKDDLVKVNRDEIHEYDGEKCILPMQAWFCNYFGVFPLPWTDAIRPVFIGFHLSDGEGTRDLFLMREVDKKMKQFVPVGCRDRSTALYLRKNGIDAYFSGCMSMTLERRPSPAPHGRIFAVDISPRIRKRLPKYIAEQADFSISHNYFFNNFPISLEAEHQFEQEARRTLERYRNEAKLVITSRVHTALPCMAMGIPVIYICDIVNDSRFDMFWGLLPIHSCHDMRFIDWDPEPVDMETMKELVIQNALAQMAYTGGMGSELAASRARLELEKYTGPLRPLYAGSSHQLKRIILNWVVPNSPRFLRKKLSRL